MLRGRDLEELNLYCNTSYRTTVSGFLGTFRTILPYDLGLACVFVKFENLGAYLCTDTAPNAFVTINLYAHEKKAPPPNGRF
jgi:hypothetical protein